MKCIVLETYGYKLNKPIRYLRLNTIDSFGSHTKNLIYYPLNTFCKKENELKHSNLIRPNYFLSNSYKAASQRMDAWVTCDFTSFSTVFQSYQDDGRMIMKGCVQWNPVYDRKDLRLRRGSNPGPLDQ